MSIYQFIMPRKTTPSNTPAQHQPYVTVPARQVIVGPSDDEVKAVFTRLRVIMHDDPAAPVPVEAKLVGWKRTNAGPLGAIFASPLTNRRELWALDLKTRKPRCIAVL